MGVNVDVDVGVDVSVYVNVDVGVDVYGDWVIRLCWCECGCDGVC